MFGLGIPEILFIVLIAIIILGPEHMPKAATMLGKWSAKLRSAATSLSQAVSEDDDLREIHHSMKTVQAELSSAKQELLRPITDTKQELLQPITDAKQELLRPITDTKQELLQPITDAKQAIQDARAELKHFAPGVETDAEPQEEPQNEQETTADFMHRPVRWFEDEEEPINKDKNGHQVYRLSSPKFLPCAISLLVTRNKIPLKPRLSTELSTAHCTVCILQPPVPKRAWCRHVDLRKPALHPSHSVIPLALPLIS